MKEVGFYKIWFWREAISCQHLIDYPKQLWSQRLYSSLANAVLVMRAFLPMLGSLLNICLLWNMWERTTALVRRLTNGLLINSATLLFVQVSNYWNMKKKSQNCNIVDFYQCSLWPPDSFSVTSISSKIVSKSTYTLTRTHFSLYLNEF